MYVRNFGRGEKWIPGEIVKSTGPVSYKVKTNDGLLVRRHADQIKVTCADQEFESITPPSSDQLRPVVHSIPKSVVVENSEPKTVVHSIPKSVVVENSEPKTVATGPRNTGISNDAQQSESENVSGQSLGSPSQPPLRRSERRVKAPDKLDL